MATIPYKLGSDSRDAQELIAESLDARIQSGELPPARVPMANAIVKQAVGLLLARKTLSSYEADRIRQRFGRYIG